VLLQDRTAIVTGASRGIGEAIARAFAREGASVVLCARSRDSIEAIASDIRESGGRALAVQTDVADPGEVARAVASCVEAFGGVDILVNNAATSQPTGRIVDVDPAKWRAAMDVNINGMFYFCRESLPHMIARGYGRIQNVGSPMEWWCVPNAAAYNCTKAALSAFTRTLAKEVAEHNVLVNANHPNDIRSAMNPGGRLEPEEIVPTALYLASLPDDGPTGRVFSFTEDIPPPEHRRP